MNLYVTHPDPYLSAIALSDECLENQIQACAELWKLVLSSRTSSNERSPITSWTTVARRNSSWVLRYNVALCAEYTHRFGEVHETYLKEVSRLAKTTVTIDTIPKEFCNQAWDIEWDYSDEPVPNSYRKHLVTLWEYKDPIWTNREPPGWLLNYEITGHRRASLKKRVIEGSYDGELLAHVKSLSSKPGQGDTFECLRCGGTIEWVHSIDARNVECLWVECLNESCGIVCYTEDATRSSGLIIRGRNRGRN